MSAPDSGQIYQRRVPIAPVPDAYKNMQDQYEAFITRNAGFLAPGDADKIRSNFQQAANIGVDPGYLAKTLTDFSRTEDYKNTRIAQGFDSAAAGAVSDNFSQQIANLSRGLQGAQQAHAAGLPQNQISGILEDYASGSPTGKQALNELVARQNQLNQQNQQLETFRGQLGTQYFGSPNATLQQALTSTSGDIGQLNQFLGEQQSRTFQRDLAPLINMEMGARGLQDSGANIELQSKALGQLEQSRQQSMMQAALGARQQIAGLQREDILGDIGARQQSLTDAFGLQRAGITMQFQHELEDRREKLARELSARNGGGPGTLQQVLGGVGMAASVAAAPWTGGASLTALPAFANYGFGSEAGQLGTGAAGMSQGFFRNDARPSIPQPRYSGPMNNRYSPWTMTGDYY